MNNCKLVFVAWSRLSTRTRNLVYHLGAELFFVRDGPPYIAAWVKTGRLAEARPDVVLVQLPQGPLLYRVLGLAKRCGFRVVADVHTGFLVYDSAKSWLLNAPFTRLLQRTSLVVVHNEDLAMLARRKYKLSSDKVMVVHDPPPRPIEPAPIDYLANKKIVLVPASWARDEPLDYVVREYVSSSVCNDYVLVITGNPGRNKKLYYRVKEALRAEKKCSNSVVLVGFVPNNQYEWLLRNSSAVIAATMREYTVLSSLWESIHHGKTVLVSKTKTLANLLGDDYPCFFTLNPGSLRNTLSNCLRGEKVLEQVDKIFERLRQQALDSLRRLKLRLHELCAS